MLYLSLLVVAVNGSWPLDNWSTYKEITADNKCRYQATVPRIVTELDPNRRQWTRCHLTFLHPTPLHCFTPPHIAFKVSHLPGTLRSWEFPTSPTPRQCNAVCLPAMPAEHFPHSDPRSPVVKIAAVGRGQRAMVSVYLDFGPQSLSCLTFA